MAIDDIKIKIDADTSDLEKKINSMQKRLEGLRQAGSGIANTSPSQQAFQERASFNIQKEVTKEIDKQTRTIERLSKLYVQIDDSAKSKLKREQDVTKEKELQHKIETRILNTEKQRSNLIKSNHSGGDGAGLPGLGGPRSGMGRSFNVGMRRTLGRGGRALASSVGIGLGGAGAILGAVGSAQKMYGQFQINQQQWRGNRAERSTAVNQWGNQIRQRAINGEGFEDLAYAPERARSLNKSMDFFQKTKAGRDNRAQGAGFGAAATVVGGAALAIGGGPLGIAAGGAMMYGGVKSLMNNEELWSSQKELDQMTAADTVAFSKKQMMAEKWADPTTHLQKQFVLKNRQGLLNRQRSSGLSDKGMFGSGGFLQRGGDEFLYGEREGMQAQMVGAGGSGQTSGDNHLLALQAQRGLGMTNSGQAMGRLTNYLGQDESKEAFIKILSKGVSIGLDDSKYVEEQKDYFNQVTALAQRMGTGEGYVASSMASSLHGSEINRRNVSAAANSFSHMNDLYNTQGGIIGAHRASLISNNGNYDKIKGMDRIGFNQMRLEDMGADSAEMKMYYNKAGGDKKFGKEGGIEAWSSQRRKEQRDVTGAFSGLMEDGWEDVKARADAGEKISDTELMKYKAGFENFTGKRSKTNVDFLANIRGNINANFKEKQTRKLKNAAKDLKTNSRYILDDRNKDALDDTLFGGTPFEQQSVSPLDNSKLTSADRADLGTLGYSTRGLESDEAAKNENKAFKDGDMAGLVTNMFSTIDATIKNQVKMELFAAAVAEGTTAMAGFIEMTTGKKYKPSTGGGKGSIAASHLKNKGKPQVRTNYVETD